MPVWSKLSLQISDPISLTYLSEKILDVDEIISIVFLICNNPVWALSILTQNLENSKSPTKILPDLLKMLSHQQHNQGLEKKFIESLIIIENFKCLKVLGYNMTEIDNLKRFFSENLENSSICQVRKGLFRICDGLNSEEMTHLVHLIDIGFKQQKSYAQYLQDKYLEIKFLSLLCQEYLSDESPDEIVLSRLIKILKSMKKFNLVGDLKLVINYQTSHISGIQTFSNSGNDLEELKPKNGVKFYSQNLNECYIMDDRNIGLCVILNQRDFSRCNNSGIELGFRHGTDSDRDMLKITFSVLGYKVMVLENKDSVEFEEEMKNIVKNHVLPEHSSFTLCILSHGKEGVIYCVDGMEVPIKKIKNWILGEECPQLLKKPKIMLIQACQGCKKPRVVQELESSSSLEKGPAKFCPVGSSASMADLIVFNATVPGYATFRSVESGSIFIQTVCSQLLKYPQAEVHEVFRKVNRILSERHISNKVITSNVDHTLTKKIFYPIKKENKSKGAVMLFEKYLINELINFCIFRAAVWKQYKKTKLARNNESKEAKSSAE